MESWVASKEAANVFDLLKPCADTLFALEQSSNRDMDRILSEEEIDNKIQSGPRLLDKVTLSLKSRTKRGVGSDQFMLKLVTETRRKSKLPYAKLLERTLKAKSELTGRQVSTETIETIESIYSSLMTLSTRRIEALSRSLTQL